MVLFCMAAILQAQPTSNAVKNVPVIRHNDTINKNSKTTHNLMDNFAVVFFHSLLLLKRLLFKYFIIPLGTWMMVYNGKRI